MGYVVSWGIIDKHNPLHKDDTHSGMSFNIEHQKIMFKFHQKSL